MDSQQDPSSSTTNANSTNTAALEGDIAWEGIEDITDAQWATEVEPVRSHSTSGRQRSSASRDSHPATSSPSPFTTRSSSHPIDQLGPSQPVTPAELCPRLVSPIFPSSSPTRSITWPASPAYPIEKHVASPHNFVASKRKSPITQDHDENEPADEKDNDNDELDVGPRLSSAQKGKRKATLAGLFAEDHDEPETNQNSEEHLQVKDQMQDEYDMAFDDDLVDFDPDTFMLPNVPSSNRSKVRSTPISTHKLSPLVPAATPTVTTPRHVKQVDGITCHRHPIMLIPDLPPQVQEFYFNHWRRGADRPKKQLSEDEMDEEDDERASRKVAAKKIPRRGGFKGRGRGFRARGRGAVIGNKR